MEVFLGKIKWQLLKYRCYFHIAYDINLCPFNFGKDFLLGHSLFGAYKLTKSAYFDKNKYTGCDIGFDARGSFFHYQMVVGLIKCDNIWCWYDLTYACW